MESRGETKATCLYRGAPIVDPTSQVLHGATTFCCANCAEAMEQRTGGSDPDAPRHRHARSCALRGADRRRSDDGGDRRESLLLSQLCRGRAIRTATSRGRVAAQGGSPT